MAVKGDYMNYVLLGNDIIEASGSLSNISSVTRCATRLRIFVKDKNSVNIEEIKSFEGVLGVVFVINELQIILGQNLTPVYEEVDKVFNAFNGKAEKVQTSSKPKMKDLSLKGKISHAANETLSFVSAAATPIMPGLAAGGMLKTFLLLIALIWPGFKETSVHLLLGFVADVPFFFMPVFIAYGAAKKLGGTSIFAMVVAAGLVYPNFVTTIMGDEVITFLSIPVTAVKYSGTLLPALLIGLCSYHVEKFLSKIIPGLVRPILLGVSTISITFALTITILGPLGYVAGTYVANIFLWAAENLGPLAVALLAGCMPFLVMTGMHHAVTPFMVQAVVDPGYDPMFRPAYLLHNMAEGGAVLGVALRAKNKQLKAECYSLAVGCIVAGVTEPAIYGVNLPLKKPMIGVVAGAASGGFVAGLLGATAYVYGYSTILALPIFQQTMMAMAIAIGIAIVVAAAVTFFLGFNEEDATILKA